MVMVGMYRIALLEGADHAAFVAHMKETVFRGHPLQATRITSGMQHQLLHAADASGHYIWVATVTLMTDRGYDFAQHETVQKHIERFGTLVGVDAYTAVA